MQLAQAKAQDARAATPTMADREEATDNGDGTDATNTESTKNPAAMEEDASEPTESEKPKKKLILTKADRINLGKQLEPLLKPTLESLVGQLTKAVIDEKTKYEILQRCYGLVTREVMRPRSCFRLPFSFKLPSPHLVVKKIIRDQKFGRFLKEYSKDIKNYEDYNMEEKGCCKQCCLPRAPTQTSQGSGAPPSADNV